MALSAATSRSKSNRTCPDCDSNQWVQTNREKVPGGVDWRYFECEECGREWRE